MGHLTSRLSQKSILRNYSPVDIYFKYFVKCQHVGLMGCLTTECRTSELLPT